MEKEFETYEYLVKYNGSVDNNINTGQQIVIVQENGNLINVNKPTEYVAQDANTKEFESVACPMFDVGQQPVYFQLNNSSHLIPISVNSIPTVETSVFENPYLLPNLTVEVIEPENDITNKYNGTFTPNLKENESMDVDANKLPGGYAEITLNDEQYELLKQKGWILLEIKDKVFLLDSSGLHEITNDYELVTKLKHESSQIIDKNNQLSGCSVEVEMITKNENDNTNIVPKQEAYERTEVMGIISGIQTVDQEEIALQATQNPMITEIPSIPFPVQQDNDTLSDDNNEAVETKMKPSKIYLKTQYLLKDIPKEIILGKTVNGKNLIARVVKGKGFSKYTAKTKSEIGRDRNINDKQFAKLIQQVLLGTTENCRMEDVASVETVMSQMFRVPDLRPDLRKHKLIVTKTLREENEDGLIENQSEPTVVTGLFIMNGTEGGFVHMPDLLQQHMKNSELENFENKNEKIKTTILEDDMFLHVNITETKDINNISRVSVMVNKRYLSLSQVYNMKTKHINAVYACTACAKVFKSQEELEEHQEYRCSEVSLLATDSEQPYTVIKTRNKIKVYMCNKCNAKFVKLKECRDHLKVHCKETAQDDDIDGRHLESSDKKETKVFKCKMCEHTYFHSSSLTKHILAKHIKPK